MAELIDRPMPDDLLPVDLVNTVWNNDEGDHVDWLAFPGAAPRFCDDHGATCTPQHRDQIRDHLVTNRALIARLFEFVSSETTADDAQLSTDINKALEAARVQVAFTNAAPSINTVDARPEYALATDALIGAIELGHDRPNRIRCCSRDGCILWFLDGSKAGRRRWCSMDRCGNRVKAQRHYDKTRELP